MRAPKSVSIGVDVIRLQNQPSTSIQWLTQEFYSGGGVQQIQLRTENGDLGAVALYSVVLEAAVIWYKKFHFI
jgi:hypothetical protein